MFEKVLRKKTTYIINEYAYINAVANKINVNLNAYVLSYVFVFKY